MWQEQWETISEIESAQRPSSGSLPSLRTTGAEIGTFSVQNYGASNRNRECHNSRPYRVRAVRNAYGAVRELPERVQ
jgi:hypothetical protein